MLKNKFKLIALLVLLILCLVAPYVRAEDEIVIQPRTVDAGTDSNPVSTPSDNAENGIMLISEPEGISAIPEQTNTSVLNSDAYLSETDIVVEQPIDGNLFAFGNTVTIKSQIGGNAFICAKNVVIEKNAYIYGSVFVASSDVKISGLINDLYVAAGTVTIDGSVLRDIKVYSDTLNIYGSIERDVYASVDTMNFTSNNTEANGKIYGKLNYFSENEISIPEGTVANDIVFTKVIKTSPSKTIKDYIFDLATFICTVAVIWLLLQWLAPNFKNKVSGLLSKKSILVFGIGLLLPIVAILAIIILSLLRISTSVALLLAAILILFICVSSSIFTIGLTHLLCQKMNIEKPVQNFGVLVIVSAILWLVRLIPTIGSIISFIIVIAGLGLIIGTLLPTKKEVASENN